MTKIITRWHSIVGATLFGIGTLGITAASAAEITVWAWDMNFNGKAMQEAAARFAVDHPDVTVNVVDFAKADLEQKLQAQLASGSVEGLPDIVLIEDYGAQKYLQSFPGAFEPLDSHVDYSGFAPYKVELATHDGRVYSMPFDSGVAAYFYRSDLLEEAGYTADDLNDITWDELIAIGVGVKEKTGRTLLPIIANDSGWARIMMQSAGRWYFDADGNATIAGNPAFKAALETYQRLMAAGITKVAADGTEYKRSFTSGDTISTFTGVWMVATIKANAEQAGKWGVAPIPRLSDVEGAVNASNIGGSSWYVLASAPEKETAIDFLATIWGQDVDFYQTILTDLGAVGSLLAARDGEAYKSNDPFFGDAPVWQRFSEWLEKIPAVSYGTFTSEANAAVSAQIPAITNGGNIDEIIEYIDLETRQQTM